MSFGNWFKAFALGAAALLLSSGIALAQEDTGNVYIVVTDTEGNPLPGVQLELTGFGAPQIQFTNDQGQARFLALSPGSWALEASLDGFSTLEYPSVNVRVARNTTLELELSGAMEEVITVTAESPLLDRRKISSGTTVSQVELEKIPTARDPWSILNQAGGVIVDRVNVGGNESGQQAVFLGLGVEDSENDFLVDGVQITDMAAIGSSATYYDFDQFTEMQFTVGGSDITKNSAGVSVNLVTKRGTNEFRGSARIFRADDDMFGIFKQTVPVRSQPDGDLAPGQASFVGNSIDQITEYGVEAGGPAIRDRLWFWGSFGVNDIKNRTGGASRDDVLNDDTILTNTAFKINAQLSSANSALASWNNGDKKKFGRNAGPTRPNETTWDQRGPTAVIKAEDTHVFGSNFFLSGGWSKVDAGFQLTARGGVGPDAPEAWLDGNGVWHDNFLSGFGSRPNEEFKADGSYFFNTGKSTSHELKFGGRLREFEDTDLFSWPGRNVFSLALGGGSFPLVVFRRGGAPPNESDYRSLWVQDTITTGRLTVNAGLRWDLQDGSNVPFVSPGSPPGIPAIGPSGEATTVDVILPTVDFAGADTPFEWESIVPRVGVTYALGEERKTLLRGSFSQFAKQLDSSTVARLNPGYYAYAYFLNLTDAAAGPDVNHKFDTGDVLYFLFPGYFDPRNPTAIANVTDPGLDPEITSEVVLGVEHALIPEFVVGGQIVWRETDDIIESRDFIRPAGSTALPGEPGLRVATVDDYLADNVLTGTLPDGSPYSVQTWTLDPALEIAGGQLMLNGDRKIEYLGGSVNFTKRLSNQWMLRGYFQYGEPEWDIPESFLRFNDPNPAGGPTPALPGEDEAGEDIDGGVAVVTSSGSGAKQDVILQSTWSWNLNGMYQIAPDRPWGFNVAANLFGREGYPLPFYFQDAGSTDGITRNVRVVTDVDDIRVDDIFTVDVRLEKEFAATGNVGFAVSLDAFNIFDEDYVLQRERDLSSGNADFLRETLSPRIWRLGVRIDWR